MICLHGSDLVFCSPNQIKQACVAIIVNATEAVLDNGEITLKTKNPDKESVTLEITDNGIGIPEDDLSHIFEPFFSTKTEYFRNRPWAVNSSWNY
jgi:two-component system, NtrC family, sensor kinase